MISGASSCPVYIKSTYNNRDEFLARVLGSSHKLSPSLFLAKNGYAEMIIEGMRDDPYRKYIIRSLISVVQISNSSEITSADIMEIPRSSHCAQRVHNYYYRLHTTKLKTFSLIRRNRRAVLAP